MASSYKPALLFTQTDEGNLGNVQLVFLSRDPNAHHQIVLATGLPANMAFNVGNQISLCVPDLATFRLFDGQPQAQGATEIYSITHGNAVSVCCGDPEGNRLKLFVDRPWYCDQPLREVVDLSQPDGVILPQVEAIAKRLPKFMNRAQWRAEAARRTREGQNV